MTEHLLRDASRNLFSRPADEHFASMADIIEHSRAARARSFEVEADLHSLFFENDPDGDLALALPDNRLAYPNNCALQQVAGSCGIPIRTLERINENDPDGLTSKVLNRLLCPVSDEEDGFRRKLFIEASSANPDILTLRSMNGLSYSRLHDAEILHVVDEWLVPGGMIPALPTMNTNENRDNIMGNNKPALFRGERDSFCFFYENEKPNDDLGGLRIGLMFWNSETGHRAFGWSSFYFRDMCANFLIWGAQGVTSKRMIHRGNIAPRWHEFQYDIRKMYEELQRRKGADLVIFAKARNTPFVGDGSPTDDNKAKAAERLNERFKLTGKRSEAVVDAALMPLNGADLSVWSIVNGITWDAKETTRAGDMMDDAKIAQKVLATVS